MAVLGLCFCVRAFSSCGKRGPLFIAVRGPLTVAASLVAEHRLQMRRLSDCGSRAQLLRGMRDLPRPGLEPVSPALAGRLSTTAPPGKPWIILDFGGCNDIKVHILKLRMLQSWVADCLFLPKILTINFYRFIKAFIWYWVTVFENMTVYFYKIEYIGF